MRSEHAVPARRLERLSRLNDYEVERHGPDPRGWTVVNREGRTIGEVKDLLVDTERMTATYLDVELDTKRFEIRDNDPHVLVPVERARAEGKRLVVDDITPAWVSDVCLARERHREEFWDRWWHRAAPRDEDLHRVVDEVQPGQEVRIPVINEEIVVERRPVGKDERR